MRMWKKIDIFSLFFPETVPDAYFQLRWAIHVRALLIFHFFRLPKSFQNIVKTHLWITSKSQLSFSKSYFKHIIFSKSQNMISIWFHSVISKVWFQSMISKCYLTTWFENITSNCGFKVWLSNYNSKVWYFRCTILREWFSKCDSKV